MRMRKKKNLDARINNCSKYLLGNLVDLKSFGEDNLTSFIDFNEIFHNSNPVHMEIGCGKGGFITKTAIMNPDINFIALEKSQNVIITALEETKRLEIKNLVFIAGMAEYLGRIIPTASLERIYLNFSCPFPKNSYANRRLTHEKFLAIYKEILKPSGKIVQKTDNEALFRFSLENYKKMGFQIGEKIEDLHNSKIIGNIMTEYEELFSKKGLPIYYIEAIS